MIEPACFYCLKTKEQGADLRPYGPHCAWLCYDCMKETPEREAAALAQLALQVQACGDKVIIDETGPRPLNPVKH